MVIMMNEKEVQSMTTAECQVETIKHIESVRKYIRVITDMLTTRGIKHDASKLESPELEAFTPPTFDSTSIIKLENELNQGLNYFIYSLISALISSFLRLLYCSRFSNCKGFNSRPKIAANSLAKP